MAFAPKAAILATSASKVATNVIFDSSNKTITINDADCKEVLFAINVTDGIVIFDPATPGKTGTRTSKNVSLVFDTSSMNHADDLLVIYEPLLEVETKE